MTPTKITIKSGWGGEWSGEVPFSPNQDSEALLEQIFRYFNRVDQEDCDRLESIGYTLPSLSVGDEVTLHFNIIGDEVWKVANVGFVRQSDGNP